MSVLVLDSSVLIAILRSERIDQTAYTLIANGCMSTVNVAEVLTRTGLSESPETRRSEAMLSSLATIEPFTFEQARLAAKLRPATAAAGLSLGDRACLALALELNAEVYTTDRAWAEIDVGVKVHLLR